MLYINNNKADGIIINNIHIRRVYANDSLVYTFSFGNATVYFQWGWESVQTGSGCDKDYYYYPMIPRVKVVATNTSNIQRMYLNTFKDEDSRSDCISPIASTVDMSNDQWVDLPIASRTWSYGDSSTEYLYLNPNFRVVIVDIDGLSHHFSFYDKTYTLNTQSSYENTYQSVGQKSAEY